MLLAYNKSWMTLYQGQFVPIATILLSSQKALGMLTTFSINTF